MTEYTDIMVDLETTGTQPDRHGILQLSAVKFNLAEKTVCHEFFDRCMFIPPHRSWAEDTRSWWGKQKASVLQEILSRAEEHRLVFEEFVDWCYPAGSLRFWSKPTHFDYSFVSSYCTDLDLINPFHYREANDLNTWLRARYFPEPVQDIHIPFTGDQHNGLMDSLHQIKVLFTHTA